MARRKEHELGKDQEEAGKEANLNAGHVSLELNEDQSDEQRSRDGLHGSHDRERLVALVAEFNKAPQKVYTFSSVGDSRI